VVTASYIFAGSTYYLDSQRLLDALNKGVPVNITHISDNYVQLNEVTIFLPDGQQEYMESSYIKKNNILFIVEKNRQVKLSMTDIEDTSNIRIKRAKKSVGVKVYMPWHSLTGRSHLIKGHMHGELGQKPLNILNRKELFLPITDVEVLPELIPETSRFDFVAVNREHIINIVELLQ
jgi:hypothetical protein